MLAALGNEVGVQAVVCQAVKRAKQAKQQRKAQISRIAECVRKQIEARQRVQHAVHRVASNQERLARQAIHPWRGKQGNEERRRQPHGDEQSGGKRAARFVKDQKGQRE